MKIIFNENIDHEHLNEYFENDDKCLDYLVKTKWSNGFECRKCGNNNFCDGKVPFSRRCTRCKNEESAIANTLFHNIKFPVSKAFYIAYQVCEDPGNIISTYDLALKSGLRQMTCWNFRHKIEGKIARLNNLSEDGSIKMLDILVGSADSPFD